MLVVGVAKCGTTTLADMLREHPQVFVSRPKELHFFSTSRFVKRGMSWYEQQFTPGPEHRITCEATPAYTYDRKALRRLTATVPDARLVAILRNPVDRAYSHYWHERRTGREEPITFEEALEREPERLARMGRAGKRRFAYVDRGHYLPELRRAARVHGREKLHVLLLEDLRADRAGTLAELFEFLGVDTAPASEISEHRSNPYRVTDESGRQRPTAYPPMDPGTRARLVEEFRESNARLAEWLGRDLPGWEV